MEYKNQQVADEINRRNEEGSITAEYIRRLRREDGPTPSIEKASYLADFFKVPLDYFRLPSDAAESSAVVQSVLKELNRFLVERRKSDENEENETLRVLARSARGLSPRAKPAP
ncbi:hypothetical protein GZL_01866 [Streptomyces sp. 769]|uniref:HTH cro/C1-type domain-containing protein n=1 Tax=Streptomyces yunnanensis TaxID=156453 RepID=A0ABY8A6F4_9ACTN|nr:hypothetical protein [Streptomyces yunnanensis]AJC54462.1 hypothetical protein GZL_01866 [Streptomyces sp. 769]WEB39257.1 hypothetical protein MOV08_08195 [Streptomyces yunnanensis]